jgi:hypothetical protein
MRSFCQDRLGTNIGKTQKWTVFLQVLLLGCDLSAPMVRNGTAADAFEIILNKEAIAFSQVLNYVLFIALLLKMIILPRQHRKNSREKRQ